MRSWRSDASKISQGEAHPYTGATWLDYVTAKERLSLAQAAINFIVSGGRKVPQDLRNLYLEAGLCTMEIYTAIFLAGEVTFNRIHFHVLFLLLSHASTPSLLIAIPRLDWMLRTQTSPKQNLEPEPSGV
jgi:hypothetical protein